MARYALVDAANNVTNVTEWDGVTPFNPGPGISVVRVSGKPNAELGGTYDPVTQTFSRAPAAPPPAPTVTERLIQRLRQNNVLTQADVDAIQPGTP